MNRRIPAVVAAAMLCGVGVGEITAPTFFILYCGLLTTGLLFLIAKKSSVRFSTVILACMLLGAAYAVARLHETDTNSIDYYNGRVGTITGSVVALPDVRDTHQKLTLRVTSHDSAPVSGKLLILLSKEERAAYGDTITTTCLLEAPQPIDDFLYDKYLSRFGMYSICAFPKSVSITKAHEESVLKRLFSFRSYMEQNIDRALPEPESSLLKGILLGDKKGLGTELTEVFRRTGLSHIVALSGFNISILVGLFLALGPYLLLSRRQLFFAISIAIVLFVIMTGASPSVVRAGIMGWIILLSYEARRLPDAINILLVVALAMVAVNPKILVWDVGWQLSFLATYAMIAIVPRLQYRFRDVAPLYGIRDTSIVTVSAVIITAPLVVWQFGGISLMALPANILILPAIPLVMSFGAFTALMGQLGILSFVWALPTWLFLSYSVWMSSLLASAPFAYLVVPKGIGTVSAIVIAGLFLFFVFTRDAR